MNLIPVRLYPGQLLKEQLGEIALEYNLQAGFILSGVGSLKSVSIRLANTENIFQKNNFFEVLSLQGSLSLAGIHVHISISDSAGQCYGGHLLDQCIVNTTMEILIVSLSGFKFDRQIDPQTGYKELIINKI